MRSDQHLDQISDHGESGRLGLLGLVASPEDWVEFADQFRHLMEQLDEEDPKVLELRLQRFPNAQIAERMECGERTVRRGLNRVQELLKGEMATLMRQRMLLLRGLFLEVSLTSLSLRISNFFGPVITRVEVWSQDLLALFGVFQSVDDTFDTFLDPVEKELR